MALTPVGERLPAATLRSLPSLDQPVDAIQVPQALALRARPLGIVIDKRWCYSKNDIDIRLSAVMILTT